MAYQNQNTNMKGKKEHVEMLMEESSLKIRDSWSNANRLSQNHITVTYWPFSGLIMYMSRKNSLQPDILWENLKMTSCMCTAIVTIFIDIVTPDILRKTFR